MPIDDDSAVCSGLESFASHVFFICHLSREVWQLTCPWLDDFLDQWLEAAILERHVLVSKIYSGGIYHATDMVK